MISLRDIPPEGLHRSFDLAGDIAARAFEGTEVDAQASTMLADLELHKSGDEVLARGRLSGELTAVCSRCVGPAKVALDSSFELLFLPQGGRQPEGEGEDELDDALEVVRYSDDVIDLGESLREELLLAIPIAPLCSESCKGLCPRCGKDLNEGPCGCPEAPRDDRWAALRELKSSLKTE